MVATLDARAPANETAVSDADGGRPRGEGVSGEVLRYRWLRRRSRDDGVVLEGVGFRLENEWGVAGSDVRPTAVVPCTVNSNVHSGEVIPDGSAPKVARFRAGALQQPRVSIATTERVASALSVPASGSTSVVSWRAYRASVSATDVLPTNGGAGSSMRIPSEPSHGGSVRYTSFPFASYAARRMYEARAVQSPSA